MSGPRGDVATLAALKDRLSAGIGPAARRTRPEDWEEQDDAAFSQWPGSDFTALDRLRSSSRTDINAARTAIELLASHLSERRPLLTAALFSPDKLLDRFLDSFADRDFPVADSWIALLWVAVAARDVTARDLPADAGFAVLDADLLRPLASRLLFLVASEPMRSRRQGKNAWWGGAGLVFGGSGVAGRALGPRSWYRLAAECQAARREWLRCLNAYESHPFLGAARPPEFEAEMRALVFRQGRFGRPLGISVRHLGDTAGLTGEDRALLDEVIERHFLPRFDLASTVALACYQDNRGLAGARIVTGAAALLAGVATVACAATLLISQAAWLAALCLVIVGAGVVAFGRAWAAPWLLRFPAAAAIGVIALISLSPGGWATGPPGGWRAAVALGAAAYGYLVVEARNHRVAGRVLLVRSIGIALVGAVYGLMVALIGLVYVAPAFVGRGSALTQLWDHPSYSHAGLALWLAASWCLAVGVFSQILWDDRPITAPLAHLSWRRGPE